MSGSAVSKNGWVLKSSGTKGSTRVGCRLPRNFKHLKQTGTTSARQQAPHLLSTSATSGPSPRSSNAELFKQQQFLQLSCQENWLLGYQDNGIGSAHPLPSSWPTSSQVTPFWSLGQGEKSAGAVSADFLTTHRSTRRLAYEATVWQLWGRKPSGLINQDSHPDKMVSSEAHVSWIAM